MPAVVWALLSSAWITSEVSRRWSVAPLAASTMHDTICKRRLWIQKQIPHLGLKTIRLPPFRLHTSARGLSFFINFVNDSFVCYRTTPHIGRCSFLKKKRKKERTKERKKETNKQTNTANDDIDVGNGPKKPQSSSFEERVEFFLTILVEIDRSSQQNEIDDFSSVVAKAVHSGKTSGYTQPGLEDQLRKR